MASKILRLMACGTMSSLLAILACGCEELPGSPGAQGAAVGGAGGAATGAVVAGEGHRGVGAIVGGALGAVGGYVIGNAIDKNDDKDGAEKASTQAQENPATPSQALNANTADVNKDGFVTMDEVVAMKKAGLTDQEMVDRLRATGQVYNLTTEQRDYLITNGVDQTVVNQMASLNRQDTPTGRERDLPASPTNQVISGKSAGK